MEKVSFFKVLHLPETPRKNSIYFVLNGDRSETYLTSEDGVPTKVGNSEMIRKIVRDAMDENNENLPDLTLIFEGALI